MSQTIQVGETIKLETTFTANGVPSDPDQVELILMTPQGTTLSIPNSKVSGGVYQATLVVGEPGNWTYQWIGEGSVTGVDIGIFTVVTSAFDDPPIYRPTIQEVSDFIRARTKDSQGNEVGKFTSDTRPTADAVERIIDLVIGNLADCLGEWLPDHLQHKGKLVVCLGTAMLIEISYYPEQTSDANSASAAFDRLYDRYKKELCKEGGQFKPEDMSPSMIPLFYFGDPDINLYYVYDPVTESYVVYHNKIYTVVKL